MEARPTESLGLSQRGRLVSLDPGPWTLDPGPWSVSARTAGSDLGGTRWGLVLAVLELVPTPPSRAALLSGSLVDSGEETRMRAAGGCIDLVVTLVNDTFALLPGYKTDLILGFRSLAPSREAGGWEAIITPALIRDLDTFVIDNRTLHLGFPQVAAYEITAPEAISFTLPASVLASRRHLTASTALLVKAEAGEATATGTL